MLEEDRTALFSSGDDNMLGSRIVGSSVAQVGDQDARDLFWMMAVVAEDVPVPMPVLELLWCAHRDVEPPLGRLGMMRLRRHVFVLLDRNLVLGESTVSLVCPHARYWKSPFLVAAHDAVGRVAHARFPSFGDAEGGAREFIDSTSC